MSAIPDPDVLVPNRNEDSTFAFPAPGREDVRSVVSFGLYKSGSTLVENVLKKLSQIVGVTQFNPDGMLWNNGIAIKDSPKNLGEQFLQTGYCFGVFRQVYRPYPIQILETNRSLIQIRDPRDILVSHYFSVTKSHPRPPKSGRATEAFDDMREQALGRSIDEHALEYQHWVWCLYRDAEPLFKNPLCRVFRYEDIIFDKTRWIHDIAKHFQWNDLSSEFIESVANANDIRPKEEQPGAHIRSVTPGDHKRKLKPETIAQLSDTFADILDRFSYQL